jgi:hypothetical protein
LYDSRSPAGVKKNKDVIPANAGTQETEMTPKPEALFRWGTAPRRLYDTLATCGEVTNYQIVRDLHILAYGNVIGKVRRAVRPYGLDVAIRRYSPGVFGYRLAIAKAEAD